MWSKSKQNKNEIVAPRDLVSVDGAMRLKNFFLIFCFYCLSQNDQAIHKQSSLASVTP